MDEFQEVAQEDILSEETLDEKIEEKKMRWIVLSLVAGYILYWVAMTLVVKWLER